jgi:hypothetical protein
MNELYNAGIYGQEITSLIDKLVLPATEIINQRHLANLREVNFQQILKLTDCLRVLMLLCR